MANPGKVYFSFVRSFWTWGEGSTMVAQRWARSFASSGTVTHALALDTQLPLEEPKMSAPSTSTSRPKEATREEFSTRHARNIAVWVLLVVATIDGILTLTSGGGLKGGVGLITVLGAAACGIAYSVITYIFRAANLISKPTNLVSKPHGSVLVCSVARVFCLVARPLVSDAHYTVGTRSACIVFCPIGPFLA